MKKCDPLEILKSNSLKATSQRVSALQEIIKIGKVFNAEELHIAMKDEADLATVYRILTILSDKNIIREINSSTGTKFYEMSCVHNPVHPHFQCIKCKRIMCLDELSPEDEAVLYKYSTSGKVTGVSILFTGICSKCE